MRTRKIEPNTYMLTDALVHVNRFLLIGGERALLLDTGYGEESMTRRLRRLTGVPLVVANTHLHPDHSDGNKLFGEVFVGEADLPCRGMPSNEMARSVAAHFKTNTKVPRRIVDKVLNYGLIDTGTEKYSPMPDVFELGGRTIETLPCPGQHAVFGQRCALRVCGRRDQSGLLGVHFTGADAFGIRRALARPCRAS